MVLDYQNVIKRIMSGGNTGNNLVDIVQKMYQEKKHAKLTQKSTSR